jgi:hypoxanthine phosphoribosyltransferase
MAASADGNSHRGDRCCQALTRSDNAVALRWLSVSENPQPLIGRDRIASRVRELAAQIDADYAGVEELVLIGVLKGSFVFLADLARNLSVPHRIEFIAVSSYGEEESIDHPGAVRLLMDVRHDVGDKHVLVVEDIVDTGLTLAYLLRLLEARGPASLKACTLLHKPERSEVEVSLDYLGFEIPDVWVVGYGLDYAERYRTLPDICSIEPQE